MAIVAILHLRSAIRAEISGGVVVELFSSVSMLLEAGEAWRDAISVFSCSTVVVIIVHRELRSDLSDTNSAA